MRTPEPQHELVLFGLGLCTPLGLTAPVTLAEMAAGTLRFFLTEELDLKGESLRASRLTLLEDSLSRTERMMALATTALRGCLQEGQIHAGEHLPLVLALPEPGSGAPYEEQLLLRALDTVAAPVRLRWSADSLHRTGRSAVFHALAQAHDWLVTRRADQVLVGAVDSLSDPESLRHLLHSRRVLSSTVRDGILPGEGAGFVLVTLRTLLSRVQAPVLGRLIALALAQEPRHFLQREPNLAQGLTEAFRQLRLHPVTRGRRVEHLLSCQTGELFWAQEFDRAYLRNAALFPEPLTGSLVAEHLGDVGAGAGLIQLGYALHLLEDQQPSHAQPLRALIYGCSDAGQVGACIVERRS